MAVLVVAIVALTTKDDKNKASKDAASTSATSASGSASPSVSASKTPSPSPSDSSSGRSQSEGSSSSSGGEADGGRLPLVVLNNTTTNGLATQAAENFREGGWTVTDIGNLTNDIVSSCAYYDPDVRGAKAAAKKLQGQFPGIKRVTEKFSELPSGPIVVVLTPDYSGG